MQARSATVVFVAALLTLATLPSWGQEPAAAAKIGYRIGPRDLLEIRVFEEPTLNVDRRVSEGGTIDLPLLGDFSVLGLTEAEATLRLKAALEASYLQRASVNVQVKEFRSRPISVIGAVASPGYLAFSGRVSLLEAIMAAGGLTGSHGDVAYVLRRADNGLSDQLEIDLDDLLVRAERRANIPIFANDVVHIPAAAEVTVFLLGEFQQPGSVVFKTTERITLLSAIAKAGGLTDRASQKVLIKRERRDGTTQEIQVSYKSLISGKQADVELEDGDLIVIKESFF